jgi:hypothetical protein
MRYVLLTLTFSLFSGFSSPKQDATYDESVTWIKGKLEQFSYVKFNDYGRSRWELTTRYKYKLISSDECTFILDVDYSKTTQQNHSNNDVRTNTVVKFNLKDIKTVAYDVTTQGFIIKTYNDEKKIFINPDKSNTTVTNTYTIYVSDLGDLKGQPERFTKAFMHAVKLCGGGKEEKF